jgi:IMP dehydrogenase
MLKKIHVANPNDKIAYARLKMFRHNVGALPVVEADGTLVGIITLRDIDFTGTDVSVLPVKDLMTTDLLVGKEDTTLGEISDIMLKTGIQRVPIIDDKRKLIGLVTQTVVIRATRSLLD